jgi:hypothetical protein
MIIASFNTPNLILDETVSLTVGSTAHTLRLQGLIYHSQSALHFTCIVVDAGGGLWFHDGMTTRRSTSYMGNLHTIGDRRWLHRLDNDKKLAAAIYTL